MILLLTFLGIFGLIFSGVIEKGKDLRMEFREKNGIENGLFEKVLEKENVKDTESSNKFKI